MWGRHRIVRSGQVCIIVGVMCMTPNRRIEQTLTRYLDKLQMEIQHGKSWVRPEAGLSLVMSDDELLRRAVEQAEGSGEFFGLVEATASRYHPDRAARGSLDRLMKQVGEFFRLSGVYSRLFGGQEVQPAGVFERFRSAFEATTQTKTHIAPIEWVYFGKERIKFGDFEIRHLSDSELNSLLDSAVRRVFYPWAYVDPSKLSGYWFLIAKETGAVDPPGRTLLHVPAPRVSPSYSRYPRAIEEALRVLALSDWIETSPLRKGTEKLGFSPWDGPMPVCIPFVISVSDHLLDWPRRAPDTSGLERLQVADPKTGEVLESPNFQVHWDPTRADEFESLLASLCITLERIRPHLGQWAFVATALNFLLKGFTSDGLEHLLWDVTCLDALLGDDGRGATRRLSERVRNVLGEMVKESFERIYQIRCDLVHGHAEYKGEVFLGHLSDARQMARLTALWMLHFLECLASAAEGSQSPLPGRKHLLKILDGNAGVRQMHDALCKSLPASFPQIDAWLGTPRPPGTRK